jgi:hypothetical protein
MVRVIVLSMVLLTGCANFDKKDKKLIGLGLSMTVVDMYQTKRIFDDEARFYEFNPLIRSKGDIIPVTVASNVIVIGCCSVIKSDKWRKRILKYWIGIKGAAITNNYNVGIR